MFEQSVLAGCCSKADAESLFRDMVPISHFASIFCLDLPRPSTSKPFLRTPGAGS
jgi:hypothetical protein